MAGDGGDDVSKQVRQRPKVQIAYVESYYDGPLSGLCRVEGHAGLLWFDTAIDGRRSRTWRAYETPPEYVAIVRAERRLFERLVYGLPRAGPESDRWRRWYEGYRSTPVTRPPLRVVVATWNSSSSAWCVLRGSGHQRRKSL